MKILKINNSLEWRQENDVTKHGNLFLNLNIGSLDQLMNLNQSLINILEKITPDTQSEYQYDEIQALIKLIKATSCDESLFDYDFDWKPPKQANAAYHTNLKAS